MKCFVIMPFAAAFDSVFEVVKDVATSTLADRPFEVFWLKDVQAAGRITDDIVHGLTEAAFCISDLTGHNPNVMWETGYAMALGKPTILIAQDIDSLPFDLKSHRVLTYTPKALDGFRERLEKSICDTLARYQLRSTGATHLSAAPRAHERTIAVTGTMSANESATCRRIEEILGPFLSENARWLTGSVGNVDIQTIRFLLDRKQRVSAVGYHRFDCAAEVRKLIETRVLNFVDASVEARPKRMTGPTERDVLFCARSDLVILFWDGESKGTRELVRYFQDQGVSTLLAFV